LLQTPAIVFCDVDSLVPVRGKMTPGFDEFSAALQYAAIPLVWVTTRTRLQIDDPRRKLGHNHPFIAEGGCGVYLPEGYFHLRPAKTIRFGRFTCIPVAEPQLAAADALEELSAETGVECVSLKALAPRELAQNSGLPVQQAELMRHRDFDEYFFFAGAAERDVERFVAAGTAKHWQLRRRDVLWSLAVGANLKQCVRDLAKLYTRALRTHPKIVGITKHEGLAELAAACDRGFLLREPDATNDSPEQAGKRLPSGFREVDLGAADVWERVVESLTGKS
jgi:mannosyl-3-phosphoglycerate phosphatase